MPSGRLSARYASSEPSTLPKVPPTSPQSPLSVGLHLAARASLSNSFRLLLFQPGPLNEYMDSQYGGHWQ